MSPAAPSALRAIMRGWLRRVARSPHRARLVLRGSLLTSAWCPGRNAADVDHLAPQGFTLDEARSTVDEVLGIDDEATTFDLGAVEHVVIWAETAFPGLRTRVPARTRDGGEALLQIDVGQGDTLVAAPTEVSIDGEPAVLGVTPETMFAWKTDGLFEFGHGMWRAKDLYDLWLIDRHVALSLEELVRTVPAAFAHQGMELSVADRFLFTDDWGASRASRRRWEHFARKSELVGRLPDIREAIGAARERLLPVFCALGHRAPR